MGKQLGVSIGSYSIVSANTIQLTPNTITKAQLLLVQRVNSNGTANTYYKKGSIDTITSIVGGLITLSGTPSLVSGEELFIVLNYNIGIDTSLDVLKVADQTNGVFRPLIEKVVDVSNLAISTTYYETSCSPYRKFSWQFVFSATATTTIKIFATWDSALAITATGATPATGWHDVTALLTGSASLSATTAISFIFENKLDITPSRFMVQVVTTNATNVTGVWINKF